MPLDSMSSYILGLGGTNLKPHKTKGVLRQNVYPMEPQMPRKPNRKRWKAKMVQFKL